MTNPSVLITGNSSGIGRGLTQLMLERGYSVYGLSRRGCDLAADNGRLFDSHCDLADFAAIAPALDSLLADTEKLELVVLNAGMLGPIKLMADTSLAELRQIMDLNVWSNKVILDWLVHSGKPVRQLLLMSSGAAVLGNRGWGGYALSKAALNMLGRLYSHELPDTHISAIAPGLIETPMTDYLCEEAENSEFPALQRIRAAKGTPVMQTPETVSARILDALEPLREFPSGSFVDLRQIFAPEEYAELMANWDQANRR